MKRTMILMMTTLLLLGGSLLPVSAAGLENKNILWERTVYEDEEITIVEELIEVQSGVELFSAKKTKSAQKNYYAKDSNDNVVATYTLKGTFSYDGSTATCTSASCESSASSIWWYFSSASARKSGASAKGSFTVKNRLSGQTITRNTTLTCSKNGTIS